MLHVICGNCGSNNDFKYRIRHNANYKIDESGDKEYEVVISCKNCATLHWLRDNAEQEHE